MDAQDDGQHIRPLLQLKLERNETTTVDGTNGDGEERQDTGPDPLGMLAEQVRHDLEASRFGGRFEGIRSELVFQRVLAKVEEDRQRRNSVMRMLQIITATAAALWNSRAVRMLMP